MSFGTSVIVVLSICSLCLGQNPGDLRLWREGSSSSSYSHGRLQVYIRGKWGEVCDEGFGKNEADVACHQLQYASAVEEGSGEIESDTTDLLDISLSDVYCPVNDYLHLLRCAFQLGQHSCSSGKGYTTLECDNSSVTPYIGQLRLVDGNYSSQGIVQVYCDGRWGTICSSYPFDGSEANTVCRQLGYTGYVDYDHLRISDISAGPLLVNNVKCPSENEQCLARCGHCSAPFASGCSSKLIIECGFDVFHYSFGSNVSTCESEGEEFILSRPRAGEIRLTSTTDSATATGLPELYYTSSVNGNWSRICVPMSSRSENNQAVADTICSQLGYSEATDYSLSDLSESMSVSVSCSEPNPHLFWCDVEPATSSCLVFSSVSCSESDVYYTGQVRLRDGDYPSEGRVEIYVYGVWSSIRYPTYSYYSRDDYETMNSICRQLGYTEAVSYGQRIINGSGPLYISSPRCYDEMPCFSQCLDDSDFYTSPSFLHDYDLHVNCSFNINSAPNITIGSESQCNITEPPQYDESNGGGNYGWIAAAVLVPLIVLCSVFAVVISVVCCVIKTNRKSRQRTHASGPVGYAPKAPGGGAVYMIPASNIPPEGIILVPPTQGAGRQSKLNGTVDEEKAPLPSTEEVTTSPS